MRKIYGLILIVLFTSCVSQPETTIPKKESIPTNEPTSKETSQKVSIWDFTKDFEDNFLIGDIIGITINNYKLEKFNSVPGRSLNYILTEKQQKSYDLELILNKSLFNMTAFELVQILGEPSKISVTWDDPEITSEYDEKDVYSNFTFYLNMEYGDYILFFDFDNKLYRIGTKSISNAFESGISIGDNIEKLIDIYGDCEINNNLGQSTDTWGDRSVKYYNFSEGRIKVDKSTISSFTLTWDGGSNDRISLLFPDKGVLINMRKKEGSYKVVDYSILK